MAQRVEVLLVDDIDDSPAAETVSFSLDFIEYSIDLSPENAAKLRSVIAPWRDHARQVGSGRRSGRAARIDLGTSNQVLRIWAAANGYQVAPHGRVPVAVRRAYQERLKP